MPFLAMVLPVCPDHNEEGQPPVRGKDGELPSLPLVHHILLCTKGHWEARGGDFPETLSGVRTLSTSGWLRINNICSASFRSEGEGERVSVLEFGAGLLRVRNHCWVGSCC